MGASKIRGGEPVDAFHSSITLGGVEYSFDGRGIRGLEPCTSHAEMHKTETVIPIGNTLAKGDYLLAALGPFFPPGTYDLLHHNCNSFTDCSIFYCCGIRMDPHYRRLELLGDHSQQQFHMMDALKLVGMNYHENPAAKSFDKVTTLNICAGGGAMYPQQPHETPGSNPMGCGST